MGLGGLRRAKPVIRLSLYVLLWRRTQGACCPPIAGGLRVRGRGLWHRRVVPCLLWLVDEPTLDVLAREPHIELRPRKAEEEAAGAKNCVFLDGTDVTQEIRASEVAQAASRLATIAKVRNVLVAEQQRAGAGGGIVMEGRDIGTVVFPNAELKIFLDASPEVRA